MVRLEHANLVVTEIEPTLHFLLTAFPHWRVRGRGEGTWASTARRWVHVGDDDYYICLNDGAHGEIRNLKGISPGLAHLGFVIDDLSALIERLTHSGFELDIVGRDHPYRSTVYYCDPAGFQFEFIQYCSNTAAEKNQYTGETGELTINRK